MFPEIFSARDARRSIDGFVDGLVVKYADALTAMSQPFLKTLVWIEMVLRSAPWWSIVIAIILLAYLASRRIGFAIGMGFLMFILGAIGLWEEGMQTLSALWEIKTACKLNPQGIASSISMNNLYAETAVELVKTYRLLKKVVAGEGEGHMLNGAERTKILWQLNSEIEQLNKKFRALALSISLYSFEDVWNRAIAGKIQKSNKTLAEEARKRQSRAMKIVAKFYKERQNSKPWGW